MRCLARYLRAWGRGWGEVQGGPPARAPASCSGSLLPRPRRPPALTIPGPWDPASQDAWLSLEPRRAGPGQSCGAGQSLGRRVWIPPRRSSARAGLGWGAHPQRVLRPRQGRPKVRASRMPGTWPRGHARAARWRKQRWSFVFCLSSVQLDVC